MPQRQSPRSNHWQKRPNFNYVPDAACGLIFTVDGDDNRATREALTLIEHFLPREDASAMVAAGDSALRSNNEDIADVLMQKCTEIRGKSSLGTATRLIRQLDTGVKHTLFFTASGVLTPDNVHKIIDAMVDDCQATSRCRFLARVIPVEDTCVGDIPTRLPYKINKLLSKHLQNDEKNVDKVAAPSYAVYFRTRNSDIIKRGDAIDIVTNAMEKLSPESRVNLTKPDLFILINVMRKTVFISCAPRYAERNKFSIRPPQNLVDAKNKDGNDNEM